MQVNHINNTEIKKARKGFDEKLVVISNVQSRPQQTELSNVPLGAYIPGMSQVKVASSQNHLINTKTTANNPKNYSNSAKAADEKPLYSKVHENEIQNKTSRIGVVDRYISKRPENMISIDADTTKDVSHGKIVYEYVANGGDHIIAEEIDVGEETITLDNKLKDIADGKYGDYDAINISMAFDINYSEFESKLGLKGVTPENIAERSDEIKDAMTNNPDYTHALNCINNIEHIIENGTPVYIAAGNDKNEFNLLTLAKRSVSVGALETEDFDKGKPIKDFSNNSEVDLYYPGKYRLEREGWGKDATYNVGGGDNGGPTGKGVVRLKAEDISSKGEVFAKNFISATSFATPNALTEDPEPHKIDWSKVDTSQGWDKALDSIKYD